jgi:hypothetical protein
LIADLDNGIKSIYIKKYLKRIKDKLMKRFKEIMLSIAVLCIGLVPAVGVVQLTYAADIQGGLCDGANLSTSGGNCEPGDTSGTVDSIVTKVINIFSWIVGVVSVIMIIYGGFRYITSGGNDTNVSAAKNTILYAIIGLVIVALAQIIVKFVIGKIDSATQ